MTQTVTERILVTVRTYPNPSAKYVETVCTGGITESGEWRRLYPVPLRYLDDSKQFRTYDIIELEVSPGKDGRPETRRPNLSSLKIKETVKDWTTRCQWVERTVFDSLKAMQDAERTIGPVRVETILDFVAEKSDDDWSAEQKEKLKQQLLFDERKPLEKIPFSFRFIWKDAAGVEYKSLFIAWEVFQTWRNYKLKYNNPISVMKDKWMNDLCSQKRRLAFFMGNSAEHRQVFMVCGVFNPPKKVVSNVTLW